MKKSLLFLFAQLLTVTLFAQSFSIEGQVFDATDNGAVPGAHVLLISEDQSVSKSAITDLDGRFIFKNIADGDYGLGISFIGYADITRAVTVNGQSRDLGKIGMEEGIDLEEVVVVENIITAIQLGDTTQINADAYKTLPDATAEDLLEKMPTVTITNGKMQAQGEDVQKVLVDGKPFFGDDPAAAIKNLPAEVIDKIQIYDEQSEQAQLTGFDDGETSKTINIILKPGMKEGQFGKIYGGYGTDDRYKLGGNINIFDGDQRISIIGMSNNINQQNFSSEDLLGVIGSSGNSRGGRGGRGGGGRGGRGGGSPSASASDFLVGQQDGITAANAGGINFSDQWGAKVEVAASYFFNKSDNVSTQITEQQYFDTEGLTEQYNEESTVESTNTNHRFSGELRYKMDEHNDFRIRPKLSYQSNSGDQNIFGQSTLENDFLSQTDNNFQADLMALNVSTDLLWRHQFDKRGRTISTRFSSGFAPQRGESFLGSESIFGKVAPDSTSLNQQANLDLNSWNAAADIRYTEPLGKNGRIMVTYRGSYQQDDSDKSTFDFDEATQDYDAFNPELSNVFSNDYFTHSLGAGYSLRMGRKFRLSTDAKLQYAALNNEQTIPEIQDFNQSAWNILPSANLRYRMSRTEHLRFSYRTQTQQPSITQLQNVLDNSNPLQLTIGNPDLQQSYAHNLRFRYSKTNTEKNSIFYAMLNGSVTNNYLGQRTILSSAENTVIDNIVLAEGTQLTQPLNLDGYWNARAFTTYGFPIKALKSNLNIDLSGTFTRTPAEVNSELNFSNNLNTGVGLTLSSNISETVDFTIGSRSALNTVNNTVLTNGDSRFFNQNSRVKFNWIIAKGIVFRTNLTHHFYGGLGDDFDQTYVLWNMSLGKKIFKNQRGEINLSVFDLLKQNNSLTQTITDLYTESVQTNVLQQYVMLSFKYDVSHFGNKK